MSIRIANRDGRAWLLSEDGSRGVDLANASDGRFHADPMNATQNAAAIRDWADGAGAGRADAGEPVAPEGLGPCVTRPRSVFAIGLNYRDHAEEAGLEIPAVPMVFTKWPSCLVGPRADVVLTGERVDWEAELVAVIGTGGRNISAASALDHVAGFCVGQDISDRPLQFSSKPPQFNLGKSADSFGPIGPAWVSLDALADPNDLEITCDVAGERMQTSRTSNLIFSVSDLVEYLSRYCTLAPGDLIFTGTPGGVGAVRKPPVTLQPGNEIVTTIEGLGTLVNRCVKQEG